MAIPLQEARQSGPCAGWTGQAEQPPGEARDAQTHPPWGLCWELQEPPQCSLKSGFCQHKPHSTLAATPEMGGKPRRPPSEALAALPPAYVRAPHSADTH